MGRMCWYLVLRILGLVVLLTVCLVSWLMLVVVMGREEGHRLGARSGLCPNWSPSPGTSELGVTMMTDLAAVLYTDMVKLKREPCEWMCVGTAVAAVV